jgi:hypothetical protein
VSTWRWWWRFMNGLRAGRLLNQAVRLRDRGELDAALAHCVRAVELAGPISVETEPSWRRTVVVGALMIDDMAARMGRPQLAREPLENALRAMQSLKRGAAAGGDDLIVRHEPEIRHRLEELRVTD